MVPKTVGDWLALLFVLAIVYVLVRPKSQAAELLKNVGAFVASLVRAATDTAK